MKRLVNKFAPAQRIHAGAGVFVLVCALGVSACEKSAGGGSRKQRTLELSSDTINLPKGVTLHEVQVNAVPNGDFDPAQITAGRGDIVRFTVRDTRTHGLVITAPSAQANTALESSTQRRSPPLVSKGQSWIVSLQGLPSGSYQVSCISHAGSATLVIQ